MFPVFCGGPLLVEAPGQLPGLPHPLNPALLRVEVLQGWSRGWSDLDPRSTAVSLRSSSTPKYLGPGPSPSLPSPYPSLPLAPPLPSPSP